MKKAWLGGALFAGVIALGSTTGCTAAPEEAQADDVPSATSEDALGRDPANCYFHHRYRKWNTTCQYGNATYAQRGAIENALTHVSGVGACVEFSVAVVAVVGGTATVVLTPAAVGAAALSAASAAGCALYITDVLRNIIPTSCTSVEVQPTDQERTNRCAMACGGTQRVYNGDCYCGRVPLACQDPPAPVGTPSPTCSVNTADGCFNTTACPLTSSSRANCSGTRYAARGARVLNIEGTKYYSCTASGWRACR